MQILWLQYSLICLILILIDPLWPWQIYFTFTGYDYYKKPNYYLQVLEDNEAEYYGMDQKLTNPGPEGKSYPPYLQLPVYTIICSQKDEELASHLSYI